MRERAFESFASVQPGPPPKPERSGAAAKRVLQKTLSDIRHTPARSTEAIKTPEIPGGSLSTMLRAMQETLANQAGNVGIDLAAKFFEGAMTAEELERSVEGIPKLNEARRVAMASLERAGIRHTIINPRTRKASTVIDFDALRVISREDWKRLGPIAKHEAYGNNTKTQAAYWLLKDERVLTPEQVARKDFEEKPAIYIPKNKSAAFSPEEIKKVKFQRGLWEMARSSTMEQPVAEGKPINLGEVQFATIIFHPEYGDGYRDSNGKLMVRDAKTREYRRFSRSIVEGYGMAPSGWATEYAGNREMKNVRTMRQAMSELFPNLIANGSIKVEDLKILSQSEERYGDRITRTTVTPDGCVMFDRVKHYIGRQFHQAPVKIYKLAEGLAGISRINNDGTETLTHTFRLFPKAVLPPSPGGEYYAGGKMTEVSPFNPEHFVLPRRADEDATAYKNRLETVQDFGMTLRIAGDLHKIGVALQKERIQEQAAIAKVATALAKRGMYDRFLRFAKEFGSDGVSAFMAAEYGEAVGTQLFEIAERLPTEKAREIMREYSALNDRAFTLGETIKISDVFEKVSVSAEVQKNFAEEIREAVMRRAKDMLYVANSLAKTGGATGKVYGGRTITVGTVDQVVEALAIYGGVLEKVDAFIGSKSKEKGQFEFLLARRIETTTPKMYEFRVIDRRTNKESYMALHLRERGAKNGAHNAAYEYDGEARVNMLFSDEPIGTTLSAASRKNALSFRIDREGKRREKGEIVANDPTVQQGEVSLEIGSFADEPTIPNGIVGRVISVGNYLASQEANTARSATGEVFYPQYYHNRESFTAEMGDADTFAGMVQFIEAKVKEHYASKRS